MGWKVELFLSFVVLCVMLYGFYTQNDVLAWFGVGYVTAWEPSKRG